MEPVTYELKDDGSSQTKTDRLKELLTKYMALGRHSVRKGHVGQKAKKKVKNRAKNRVARQSRARNRS